MTVKRYDAHTNIDDFKADWHEKKDGYMVRYSDYATLLADRDALKLQVVNLAVENASMLSLLTDISDNHGEFVNEADDYMCASVPLDYVSEINMYVSRDVNAENPFAATDAALANIQAQGVEKFAVDWASGCDDSTGGVVSSMANEFAAQLREGAAV